MNERFLSKAKVKCNGQNHFSGDWIEGYYTYSEYYNKHYITIEVPGNPSVYFTTIEIYYNTLCKSTGESDKNNRLIFEGDWHLDDYGPDVYICVWQKGEFKWKVHEGSNLNNIEKGSVIEDFHDIVINNIEIKGNIHDKKLAEGE